MVKRYVSKLLRVIDYYPTKRLGQQYPFKKKGGLVSTPGLNVFLGSRRSSNKLEIKVGEIKTDEKGNYQPPNSSRASYFGRL